MKRVDILLILILITSSLVIPVFAVLVHHQSNDDVILARTTENGGWSQKVIHLKVGVDNELKLMSQDVLHSFYVPGFNLSRQLYPGHLVTIHITPTRTGTFPFQCLIFCSPLHSMMVGKIIVS